MENSVHLPELEACAIQLGTLPIFCRMCKETRSSKEKKIHRSKFLEACLGIIQQSLLILTEENDIVIMSGNISIFISLCRKCDGSQGLVFEEFVKRESEYEKNQQPQNGRKSPKVISIRGASTPE